MRRSLWRNFSLPLVSRERLHKLLSGKPVLLAVSSLALAALLSSCQPASPAPSTPQPPGGPSQPVPQATPAPPAAAEPPRPVEVSAPAAADANRPVIIEFAKAVNSLNRDWEGYRRSYEEWRQKGACNEAAMTDSLSGFVTTFRKTKKLANELPQAQLSRAVAERLVEAAEKEETALSELRTGWKPGDEAAFQKYEAARQAADRLRRQAAQSLDDLVTASQGPAQEAIDKYRQALQLIEKDWDALNKSFDDWRKSLTDAKSKDKDAEKTALDALQKMASRSQDILNRVYALPRPQLIQKPADLLITAAETQDAAFRKLNSTWKPGDEDSLSAFEKDRAAANKLRRDSTLGVDGVAAAGLRENKALLAQFSALNEQMDKAWTEFRSQYDAWRNKGGDCDRNAIRQQLTERATSFHSLAQRAFALPQASAVRPLAELVTQGAEREETALRQLRDSWKPYDSSFYQSYEKEWVAIDRLRRQAAAGLTDLMQRSEITPADIR